MKAGEFADAFKLYNETMCGRFTLRTKAKDIAAHFVLADVPNLKPRYNIAPTQDVGAVRLDPGGKREFAFLRWGLIPSWAKDTKTGYSMINARAESVATKPSFRSAFKKRRCLILADGFYEWKKVGDKKQPFLIHLKDDESFAFAGLWERWQREKQEIQSCTIIVTEPNTVLEEIHDRMPVILPSDEYDLWLDPEFEDTKKLEKMLRPYPPDEMEAYPVSTLVNNPRNDMKECAKAVSI